MEATVELAELSNIKQRIISAQTSTPNIVIVQDSLLGAYDMTKGLQKISRQNYNDIVLKCDFSDKDSKFLERKQNTIRKVFKENGLPSSAISGKGLFSLLLPEDFNYEFTNKTDPNEPTVKIYRGVLYSGTLSKVNLGKSSSSLVLLIHKEYGKEIVSKFIDNVQFMTNNWLLMRGFSIGLGDCLATKEDEIYKTVNKCFIKAKMIEETTSHPGIRETRISAALNDARNIGLSIAKDGMSPTNGFVQTVTSGSKGDYFNIGQITGILGQQNLEGKRIPLMLNQGRRSLPHYKLSKRDNDIKMSVDDEYESRGFIKSSFIKGLNPKEFYFHSISGREGVTDTAMKTAKSGYIQRRIIKCMEDLQVCYDGTVRDTVGSRYQLSYGDHGFDPSSSLNLNGEVECCNVSRIVNRINLNREIK